ncbi:MAG: DNA ligase D [Polyangiaceae bacterium]
MVRGMELGTYRKKRDFHVTPEPRGVRSKATGWSYVIQKHAARRLHYDFRLELDGVLLSWAVPKGPSIDPAVKRLAVQTEDHPVDYGSFEGTIPRGEYGGGTVMLWDTGTWSVEGGAAAARAAYAKGRLTFTLHGERLRGRWHLVRSHGNGSDNSWLLFKGRDDGTSYDDEPVSVEVRSVTTERTMDEIRAAADRVWRSNRTSSRAPRDGAPPAARPPASAVELPKFVPPELAALVRSAPEGDEWLHEIKLDGYRVVAHVIPHSSARLFTRSGKDWTSHFPSIADALQTVDARSFVLDGELVVFDEHGVSRFQLLQHRARSGDKKERLTYVAFDLLHLDGEDLTPLPLVERKAKLEALLHRAPASVRVSKHIEGRGEGVLERARELGLEGIISKRRDSPYRPGRTGDWLKVKCGERQEFVIVGTTPSTTNRRAFGALALATRDAPAGPLRYVGKVGTGFDSASLERISRALAPLRRKTSPLGPSGADGATAAPPKNVQWVRPELVAEVAFTETTSDGRLRHPTFLGLREDKAARAVELERPLPSPAPAPPNAEPSALAALVSGIRTRVRFTRLDKVLFPSAGITKAALIAHYSIVAEWMLPHVADRPLTLLRCPDGAEAECFFQKHATKGTPEALERIELTGDKAPYLTIRGPDGLLAAAQHGVLEIHTWGARARSVEKPDLLVFDLDPDPSVGWDAVVDAALGLRTLLARLELESWVKTTGGKGLHVAVPLTPRVPWPHAKDFSRDLCVAFADSRPGRFTTVASKSARKRRIFLDWLRNARGATAVAPYSTRKNALVATPLAWDELERGAKAEDFTLLAVAERVRSLPEEPWASLARSKQTLSAAARRAVRR